MKPLASSPSRIDVKYLEQFPEFMEFREASKPENSAVATAELPQSRTTPEEAIELAHQGLREQLAAELISRILGCSPTFFEQLVVELLVKMGYGGSQPVQRSRKSNPRFVRPSLSLLRGCVKTDCPCLLARAKLSTLKYPHNMSCHPIACGVG